MELSEIDPIFFDRTYYAEPTGGENAYALLLAAMRQTGKAGIAKTVLGNKETLIVIRAQSGGMLLSTMHFAAEIRQNKMNASEIPVKPEELKLAKSIIENMSGPFQPEEYKDEYREKVQKAIETKISGKKVGKAKPSPEKQIGDLMDALKVSLYETKPKTRRKIKGLTAVR